MLIHAAAGGSGSAAIQLAVNAGARVFATASSEAMLKLCRELGAHVAVNYSKSDFAAVAMAKSLGCLSYNGRYLMMGFASNKAVADEQLVSRPRSSLAPSAADASALAALHSLDESTDSPRSCALRARRLDRENRVGTPGTGH